MARPLWQVFQARDLAGRMGSTPGSHMAAALIVRDMMAKNPGLDRTMLAVVPATQEDWAGADKPLDYVNALLGMWTTVGVSAEGSKSIRTAAVALRTLARTAYLTLPPAEIEAATEIAAQSKLLPWFGAELVKTGEGVEEIWGGGWDGFGRAGFGALRDELLANVTEERRTSVAEAYDEIASNTTVRKELVRRFQRVMQAAGYYDGAIDGLWGPKSEAAFLTYCPGSYARPTTLADLRTIMAQLTLVDSDVVAMAISRDSWVVANPDKLPPQPVTPPPPVTTTTSEGTKLVEDTILITPSGEAAGTPIGNEQDGDAHRFFITLPDGNSEEVTVRAVEEDVAKTEGGLGVWPWVLLGGAGLAGLWLAFRKRTEETA